MLDNLKLKESFQLEMRPWQTALEEYLKDYFKGV